MLRVKFTHRSPFMLRSRALTETHDGSHSRAKAVRKAEKNATASHSTRAFGVSSANGDQRIWPVAKVHKRILNGTEDNVWAYSQVVIGGWK
jgi:hypothetical protein